MQRMFNFESEESSMSTIHLNIDHSEVKHCQLEPLQKPVTPQELAESSITILQVWGMGCPTCATRVHNALLALDGVVAVGVTLAQGLAFVRYDPIRVSPGALPDALAAISDGRHHYTAVVLE
jgi:copper chaperone